MLTTLNYIKPDSGSSSLDHAFINAINDCIEENFSDPQFNANALALYMGMSRSHLHKKLLKDIGQTPGKYILQTRLAEAKILLNDGNEPIKNIAYQCGFSSYTTFWNAFHKCYASNPGDLIRNKVVQLATIDWYSLPNPATLQLFQDIISKESWFQKFLRLALTQVVNHQCSVEKLAEILCLSSFQLSNRIDSLIGIKPMAFLKYLRILYAAELMQDHSSAMTSIAYKAGFSDQSHMCRDFKAQFGMSPTVYRSLYQNNAYFSEIRQLILTKDDE